MVSLVPAEVIGDVVNIVGNETNPVTFSCEATGEPVPTIIWHFNSIMIITFNSNKYNISNSTNGSVITSVFTILNTQSSDVGTYTCYAKNDFGDDQNSAVLTINGKQKCLVIFKYVHSYIHTVMAKVIEPSGGGTEVVMEENIITLRCVGVGYPPPLVQWRKLNGSLSDRVSITNMSMSTNEGNVTNVTVDLIFTGAYRENTGVYECSVSNLLNHITRNISLIVQCMYVFK